MARKANDPNHEELRKVLQYLLDRDEDITARGVVRLHPSLRNASDITRHQARKALLDEAIKKQSDLRKWGRSVKKTGSSVAAEKLQSAEERIHELEANEAARVASHLAMIRAVAELGGTVKLLKFYESFAEVRNRLVEQGALPQSFKLSLLPADHSDRAHIAVQILATEPLGPSPDERLARKEQR